VSAGHPLHVLVMAKAPVPGRVKTRLCPPLSPEAAADIAASALADTLQAVAMCSADVKILALEGEPGPWLPEGFRVMPQVGRGLDDRLAHAWLATRTETAGWGIQIGMDTPQVTGPELDALLDMMCSDQPARALLGPAVDGGWWVIGLAGLNPRHVFTGVPMSTPQTGAAQLDRLRALGTAPHVVHTRRDIDRVADLAAVADHHPLTRTASAWRRWLRSPEALAS